MQEAPARQPRASPNEIARFRQLIVNIFFFFFTFSILQMVVDATNSKGQEEVVRARNDKGKYIAHHLELNETVALRGAPRARTRARECLISVLLNMTLEIEHVRVCMASSLVVAVAISFPSESDLRFRSGWCFVHQRHRMGAVYVASVQTTRVLGSQRSLW